MDAILIIILWGMVWESTTISGSRVSTFVKTKQQKQDMPKANIAGDIFDSKQDFDADEGYINDERYFVSYDSATTENSKGRDINPVTETRKTAAKRNKRNDRKTTICTKKEQVTTCECDETIKEPDLSDDVMNTKELNITGCEKVTLRTDLNLTAMETLKISSVKEITIEQSGLFVPLSPQGRKKMKVHVEFSNITAKSKAFGGFLGELYFHNVSFSNILKETFMDMDLDKLEFINSTLDYRVEAFKNCSVTHMKISGSKLSIIETNGLNIRKAISFSFARNKVGRLNKEAFNVKADTVHFRDNIFEHVEGDAFKAIEFSSNFTFEAILIKSREKNVLKTLRPSVVKKLRLGDNCSCGYLNSIEQELVEEKKETTTPIADNTTQILLKAIECRDGRYIPFAVYDSKHCTASSSTLLLIIVVIVLFLAFISVLACCSQSLVCCPALFCWSIFSTRRY